MARQKPILCKTVSIESYPLQLEGQGEGLGWQKTVAKHTQSLQWVVKLSHWLLHCCFCGTDAAAQESGIAENGKVALQCILRLSWILGGPVRFGEIQARAATVVIRGLGSLPGLGPLKGTNSL